MNRKYGNHIVKSFSNVSNSNNLWILAYDVIKSENTLQSIQNKIYVSHQPISCLAFTISILLKNMFPGGRKTLLPP